MRHGALRSRAPALVVSSHWCRLTWARREQVSSLWASQRPASPRRPRPQDRTAPPQPLRPLLDSTPWPWQLLATPLSRQQRPRPHASRRSGARLRSGVSSYSPCRPFDGENVVDLRRDPPDAARRSPPPILPTPPPPPHPPS